MIVGGSCLWSPAKMNLRALAIGINTLGMVACEASSTITTSNLVCEMLSRAADEFVDKMTSLNEIFAEKITLLSTAFIQMGHDSVSAIGMAQGKIYGQLIQQSTLCAFINAYKIYAIMVLILIPLVFVMKKFDGENTHEKQSCAKNGEPIPLFNACDCCESEGNEASRGKRSFFQRGRTRF